MSEADVNSLVNADEILARINAEHRLVEAMREAMRLHDDEALLELSWKFVEKFE